MPRDEHDLLAGMPSVGQHSFHLGEDRVVAAAGAPAHFLVGDEVLPGEDGQIAVDRSVAGVAVGEVMD